MLFQEKELKADKILKSRNPISCDCTFHHNTVLWATVLNCTGDCCILLATDSEKGQVAGTCKCRKDPSVSIKCGEFLH